MLRTSDNSELALAYGGYFRIEFDINKRPVFHKLDLDSKQRKLSFAKALYIGQEDINRIYFATDMGYGDIRILALDECEKAVNAICTDVGTYHGNIFNSENISDFRSVTKYE